MSGFEGIIASLEDSFKSLEKSAYRPLTPTQVGVLFYVYRTIYGIARAIEETPVVYSLINTEQILHDLYRIAIAYNFFLHYSSSDDTRISVTLEFSDSKKVVLYMPDSGSRQYLEAYVAK